MTIISEAFNWRLDRHINLIDEFGKKLINFGFFFSFGSSASLWVLMILWMKEKLFIRIEIGASFCPMNLIPSYNDQMWVPYV